MHRVECTGTSNSCFACVSHGYEFDGMRFVIAPSWTIVFPSVFVPVPWNCSAWWAVFHVFEILFQFSECSFEGWDLVKAPYAHMSKRLHPRKIWWEAYRQQCDSNCQVVATFAMACQHMQTEWTKKAATSAQPGFSSFLDKNETLREASAQAFACNHVESLDWYWHSVTNRLRAL